MTLRLILPVRKRHAVLEEIEAIRRARGDRVLYSVSTIAKAFGVVLSTEYHRANHRSLGFQGDLLSGPVHCGTWLDAVSVNKATVHYATWADPENADRALRIAHEIVRLLGSRGSGQGRLDKWQLSKHTQKAE